MLTFIILIVLNFFIFKMLKNKKIEVEKNNYKYKKKYQQKYKKNYNIYLRLFIFNFLFICIWFIISYFINNILINNYQENIDKGILKYYVIKEIPLKEISENIYVEGYESTKDDTSKYRAYHYILEDGTTISKTLNSSIRLNFGNENKEIEGKIIYDNFLKLFFVQFYTYQYKQVYVIKEQARIIENK